MSYYDTSFKVPWVLGQLDNIPDEQQPLPKLPLQDSLSAHRRYNRKVVGDKCYQVTHKALDQVDGTTAMLYLLQKGDCYASELEDFFLHGHDFIDWTTPREVRRRF